MRILALVVLAAASVSAQTPESTLCQAEAAFTRGNVVERRLIGCGEGFPDNLLWHLDRSDSATGALDGKVLRKTTGRGAVIYVLDTGVMRAHDEFARSTGPNVIAGLVADQAPPDCPDIATVPCGALSILAFGHGTGVASVAAGRHTGVAPDASIVSVYSQGDGFVWFEALKKVIAHAYEPTAPSFQTAIINISGGMRAIDDRSQVEPLLRRMVEGVDANGNADPNGKRFLIVAAAGNFSVDSRANQCSTSGDTNIYPALIATSVDGLVSVGGIDRTNAFWVDSCKGPLVELAAPAEDMFVASIGRADTYRFKPEFFSSGTSWATPYVSGIAARHLETNPSLTPAQLESILRSSPSSVDGVPVPVILNAPVIKRRAVRQ